jgi:hypothetical protein
MFIVVTPLFIAGVTVLYATTLASIIILPIGGLVCFICLSVIGMDFLIFDKKNQRISKFRTRFLCIPIRRRVFPWGEYSLKPVDHEYTDDDNQVHTITNLWIAKGDEKIVSLYSLPSGQLNTLNHFMGNAVNVEVQQNTKQTHEVVIHDTIAGAQ